MYIGCLLIPAILLLFLAIAVVKGLLNMGFNVISIIGYKINSAINSFLDFITSPFRAKPVESDLEDPNYYQATEEKEKKYNDLDGDYVSYKKVKR